MALRARPADRIDLDRRPHPRNVPAMALRARPADRTYQEL